MIKPTTLALTAALLVGPVIAPLTAEARDGRGGGGSGGGGRAYHFSAPRRDAGQAERAAPVDRRADRDLNQGYRGSHPLYGDGTRTSWTGHNISADQFRRFNQAGGNRSWNNVDTGRFNNQFNRENNFYNRNYGGWNNNWANGGYWGSRPWGYGWYNWSPDTWGWWGNTSLGWGLASLAGADVITSLVNAASEQQSPEIAIPDSDYQLNYATVDSVGSGGADFSYAVANSPPIKGAANCQQGLLDGQVPSTAAQAQLLNAACQVAYGPDPKGTPLPENLTDRLPGWLRDLLLLALGGGVAVAAWRLLESRRRPPASKADEHHAPVTSS